MSRKLYPLLEVLCVAALIAFITFLVLSRSGGTEKPVGDVASPVLATLEEGQMTEQSNADAAKAFGFDLSRKPSASTSRKRTVSCTTRTLTSWTSPVSSSSR